MSQQDTALERCGRPLRGATIRNRAKFDEAVRRADAARSLTVFARLAQCLARFFR